MLNSGKKSLTMILVLLAIMILMIPGNVKASEVSMVAAPRIDIHKTTDTLKKGKTDKVVFSVANTTKQNVVWTSSDPKVVKVNSRTGKIRGISGGKATITATVAGTNISDSITVKCKDYYLMRVKTTGYCNGHCCAGGWAGHATASGRRPRANHTIAVDRSVIKLGTKVMIDNKMYVAEDTGVHGRVIDIYYKSHSRASRHGVQYKTVKVFF